MPVAPRGRCIVRACRSRFAPVHSGRATRPASPAARRVRGCCAARASTSNEANAWPCSGLPAPGPRRCSTVSPGCGASTRAASSSVSHPCSSTWIRSATITAMLPIGSCCTTTAWTPAGLGPPPDSLGNGRIRSRPPSSPLTSSRGCATSPIASCCSTTAGSNRSISSSAPAASPNASNRRASSKSPTESPSHRVTKSLFLVRVHQDVLELPLRDGRVHRRG